MRSLNIICLDSSEKCRVWSTVRLLNSSRTNVTSSKNLMTEFDRIRESESFELVVATERLLSKVCKDRIHISQVERLTEKGRRNLLLRCFIHPVSGLPSSFIVKKVEAQYNRDRTNWDTKRFFNDWTGSQFLNTISSEFQHSPILYGGDRDLGFIVIEDVQHQNTLVEPLLGSDRNYAEWALLQYATCLLEDLERR